MALKFDNIGESAPIKYDKDYAAKGNHGRGNVFSENEPTLEFNSDQPENFMHDQVEFISDETKEDPGK